MCEQSVSQYPVNVDTETLKVDKTSIGWAIHSCMMSVLKVLLNLTHENGKNLLFVVISVMGNLDFLNIKSVYLESLQFH